jgi:hypothetical protein
MYLRKSMILKNIFDATIEDSEMKRGNNVTRVERINFNTSYSIPLRTPKVNLLKLVNNTQDEIKLKDEKIKELESNVDLLESTVLTLESNKEMIEGHNTHLEKTLIKMCVYALTKGTDRFNNNYTPKL